MKSLELNKTNWRTVYTGENPTSGVMYGGNGITLAPKSPAANNINETHACLVVSSVHERAPLQNFEVSFYVKTLKQTRPLKAKPWECFWFLFNYTIDEQTKKKTCNYFILKPNGVELGAAYSDVGQKFIASASSPRLVFNHNTRYYVKKSGHNLYVSVDGLKVLSGSYPGLYDHSGTFGLYCEDAIVTVSKFSIV
jgi:hypothetical protein